MEEIDKKYPYLGMFTFPNNNEMYYIVLFNKQKSGMVVSTTITGNDLLNIGNYSEEWDENVFQYLDKDVEVRLNN